MTKQFVAGILSRANLINGNAEELLANRKGAAPAIISPDGSSDATAESQPGSAPAAKLLDPVAPSAETGGAGTGAISLTTAGAASTQNFNALATSGTSSTLPTGWYIQENGTSAAANGVYTAGTGSSNAGDVFSFGSAATPADRALGSVLSGTNAPSFGAQFTNSTGSTLGSLDVSFTGEQWRFGGAHSPNADKLNFQISLDATSLSTGTWIDVDSLDFNAPVTAGTAGGLDGNAAANRTAIAATISGLSIASGATFWVRFVDFDASSSDDGLAIDDFSITPVAASGPTPGVLTVADVSIAEGNSGDTDMVFTVTRASGSQGAVDVTYTITNGTTDAGDFGAGFVSSATVSFADGQTTAQIHVPISGDTSFEPGETFSLALSDPTGGATLGGHSTATGTITNDDAAPAGTLSIGNASLAEGDSGDTDMVFTVTRANGSAGAVSATWTIANGTANAGDFGASFATTGTVNFADGATTAEVHVPIHGDTTFEPNETFTVTLSAPTGGAALGTVTGTGTITNDDAAPPPANIWINEIHYDNSSTDVGEAIEIAGIAGTDLTGYKLVLYNGTNTPTAAPTYATTNLTGTIDNESNGYGAVSFAYAVNGLQNGPADGIALISPDGTVIQFLSYGGAITAAAGTPAAGMTSTDIGVSESPAPGVGFSLQLTGTGSTYADFTWQNPADDNFGTANTGQSFLPAVGTSHIRVEDASAVEGNSGTTNITFTVHRAGGQAAAASVGYTVTLDGTADAADLGAAAVFNGTVSFGIDEFTKTITIPVQGDTTGEHNETFHVVLGSTTGDAVVDRGTATGTITNDDPLPLLIGEIQGAGHSSVYVNQTVIATGIVTAVDTNGFYLQDAGDGNSGTSDGIFVFTSTTPTVAVGDAATVTGTVTEFLGAAGSLTLTQITAPTVEIGTHNNTLPTAILIGQGGLLPPTDWIDDDGLTSYDPTTDGVDFWESMEGMRVTIDNPLVVSNTTSFGETDVVASLGVGATGVNDRGGITISPNADGKPADYNPEKIQIDDDSGIFAGFNPNYSIGDHLSSVTGILNYGFANYEVIVTEAVTLTQDVTLTKEITTLVGDATHLSLATYNVENLDTSDNKFDILADNIVYNLRAPDIIALQEIQDADGAGSGSDLSGTVTAQGLIDAIFAESGLHYAYIEIAPSAAGTTGGEPGGNIRNGYLYNVDRVSYVAGSAELITGSAYNGSRNPLVASWMFNGQTITTIDVHSTSRGGSEDLWGDHQPPADAGDAARTAQAAAIKAYINDKLATDPNLNIAVLGDWNGFYFEDAQTQLTDPGQGGVLTNLNTLLAEQERYSYLFNGNAQQIDNMLVTHNLLEIAQYDAVHLNSQFGAAGRPTDHDPQVALFEFGPTPLTNDLARTVENATVVIDVLANDVGSTGPVATIAGVAASVGVPVTLPSGATVTLGADGKLTYDPNGVYNDLISPETAAATGASNSVVIESFSYTLGSGASATVEVRVTGVDTPGDPLLGTSGVDTITGTSGADFINAGASADTMSGGAGDDIYVVDNSADVVNELSGQGEDTVRSYASFTLVGYVENLSLLGNAAINATGNSLANIIYGNSAANTIDGGAGNDVINGLGGADTMIGGMGDDTFYVAQVGDVAIEGGGQGYDIVYSTITYSLVGQYIEQLNLAGASAINGTGNSLANVLIGNGGNNILDGADGNDDIDGHEGIDTMIGGLGDDTFHVDQAGDLAVEAASAGYDTVLSSITYSLAGQYIEALTLTGNAAINGTGNSLANVLTGNSAANILTGGDGNDTINGMGGADTMNGGLGNDIFYVDEAGDLVVEANGEGTDTVNAAVTYSLAGQFIENLTLTGSNAINGTGNKLDNVLTGNGAANTLTGGEGNDTIDGGAGADTMIGGVGDDSYTVDNAGDVVVEAGSSGTDKVFASVSFSLAGQYIENLTLTGGNAINATGNSLANILTGNSAANVLSGGDGNDTLHGGLGADTLTGGNGSDGFAFDTALGGGNIDTITDFSVPADTIYLDSAIFNALGGDGTLSAAAFVNGSAALDADDRILYDSTTGNIYYDADGVGGAAAVQFAKVTAGTALTRADFVIQTGLGSMQSIQSFGAQNEMASVRFVLGGDAILSDDGGKVGAGFELTGPVTRGDLLHEVASHSAVMSVADLFGNDLGGIADALILDGHLAAIEDDSALLPAIDAVPQHTHLLGNDWAAGHVL